MAVLGGSILHLLIKKHWKTEHRNEIPFKVNFKLGRVT